MRGLRGYCSDSHIHADASQFIDSHRNLRIGIPQYENVQPLKAEKWTSVNPE